MADNIVESDKTVVNRPQHVHPPCRWCPGAQPFSPMKGPLMHSEKKIENREVIIKWIEVALNKLTTLDGLEEFVWFAE